MASGIPPYWGAAACSRQFPFDTTIRLTGKDGTELTVVCKDRGHIDAVPWIDVFVRSPEEGRYIATTFSPYSYGVLVPEILPEGDADERETPGLSACS